MNRQVLYGFQEGKSKENAALFVKPPKVEMAEKDKAFFIIEDRIVKIEAALKRKTTHDIWLNIMYSAIGAIVGSVITIILTRLFHN